MRRGGAGPAYSRFLAHRKLGSSARLGIATRKLALVNPLPMYSFLVCTCLIPDFGVARAVFRRPEAALPCCRHLVIAASPPRTHMHVASARAAC